jgi:cyclophilin family peptidyl-prolyl cis-trans isomerase
VASAVEDRSTAVQVTAIQALGQLRAPEGVEALQRVLRGRRAWAVRREALVALARIDATAFRAAVLSWGTSGDWRDRAAAAEGWARVAPTQLARFTDDADARVVAAALQAWADAVPGPDPTLLAAARLRLTHPDAAVRAVSAQVVARALSRNDVPLLVEAYHRAARDSFPDAAQMALGGLAGIAASPDSGAVTGFVLGEPAPADPLLKAWAEANWPALAERWGWSRPIETGRTLEDYRDIARRYLVSVDAGRYPRVVMEVQDRGAVPMELFGPDAPLTVANFLRLVDQRYFDGLRFHRVVPNFVVQTGDPRGDGWGGPGWSIRDEINRRRYGSGVVGMALSGPDTGGSQWFITLSPQPRLDGGYSVFGRLRGGDRYVAEITQGDLIRSIHR